MVRTIQSSFFKPSRHPRHQYCYTGLCQPYWAYTPLGQPTRQACQCAESIVFIWQRTIKLVITSLSLSMSFLWTDPVIFQIWFIHGLVFLSAVHTNMHFERCEGTKHNVPWMMGCTSIIGFLIGTNSDWRYVPTNDSAFVKSNIDVIWNKLCPASVEGETNYWTLCVVFKGSL